MKTNKKIIIAALTLTLSLGLTACNQNKQEPLTPETKAQEETTLSTDTTQETGTTQTTQETNVTRPLAKINFDQVEKEMEKEFKGNMQYAEIRDFDFDEENGNVKIEVEVEQGTSKGTAETLANTIYKKFGEIMKAQDSTITNYGANIEIEEDSTDVVLFQAMFD